jgi:hypothetical protein
MELYEYNNFDKLIDRILEKDPLMLQDDIEVKIEELNGNLKFFDLDIDHLYFK